MKLHRSLPYILLAILTPVVSFAQGAGGGGGGIGGAGGGGFGAGGYGGMNEPHDGGHYVHGDPEAIFGVIVALVLIAAAITWYFQSARPMLMSVALVVRRGRGTSQALDAVIADAEFRTREERSAALALLLADLTPEVILAGRVQPMGRASYTNVDTELESRWRDHMERTHITPRVLNVAPSYKLPERYNQLPEPTPAPRDDPSVCFVELLIAVPPTLRAPAPEPDAIREYLRRYAHAIERQSYDTFYVYYTPKSPETDAPLGAEEAKQMLAALSAPQPEARHRRVVTPS